MTSPRLLAAQKEGKTLSNRSRTMYEQWAAYTQEEKAARCAGMIANPCTTNGNGFAAYRARATPAELRANARKALAARQALPFEKQIEIVQRQGASWSAQWLAAPAPVKEAFAEAVLRGKCHGEAPNEALWAVLDATFERIIVTVRARSQESVRATWAQLRAIQRGEVNTLDLYAGEPTLEARVRLRDRILQNNKRLRERMLPLFAAHPQAAKLREALYVSGRYFADVP